MTLADMPDDQKVRLLRAKAGELEGWLLTRSAPEPIDYLAADLALVAGMLADEIERRTAS